jgi:hypothetical protein
MYLCIGPFREALTGRGPYFNDAISIAKRYFTSLRNMRW